MNALRWQSGGSTSTPSQASGAANPSPSGGSSTPTKNPTTPKKSTTPIWPTAEEEKVRLYDQAQAIVKRTQAYGAYSPSLHSRTSSENAPPRVVTPPHQGGGGGIGMMSPTVPISAGAALYQSAVSSMSARPSSAGMHASSSSGAPAPAPASVPQYSPAQASPSSSGASPRSVPQYPSAADEKAALKLYHEAKRAVDRNQNIHVQQVHRDGGVASPAPIAYEALYPSSPAGGSSGGDETGRVDGDLPPPFEASTLGGERPLHDDSHLSEKERLRRQYEAQDAAAAASALPPPHTYSDQGASSSPAYMSGGGLPSYAGPPAGSGLSEKELLRRRYEEQDAATTLEQQSSPPPFMPQPQAQLPFQHQLPSPPLPRMNGARTQPVPPAVSGMRPLTAAEEKAQLKAKYEAEEREARNAAGGSSCPSTSNGGAVNGYTFNAYDDLYTSPPASRHPYANGGVSPSSSPPPPPPLMPRPPAEYIQQTQEEDIRGRHYYVGVEEALQGLPAMRSTTPGITGALRNPHLEMRPFSPFDAGLGYRYGDASGTRSPPPRS